MIHINADSYSVKAYNSDSIIVGNKRGLEARFFSTKSSAAKAMIQYHYSNQKNK